ncbi:MAG: DUF1415 domain-containing protein [Saprospiraceae bacterium]|nr:DUF1415 domain-containing protein [Saprospiraceae bacterium]
MTDQKVIDIVTQWIDEFIIGYNICPFASYPFKNDLIQYLVSESTELEDQLYDLVRLFVLMMSTNEEELSNSFLIFSQDQSRFEDFLIIDDMAEMLLEEYGFTEHLQVVLFHPEFSYADEDPEDPSNLTNKSPYPMIHVLRKKEVQRAIESHKHTDDIPKRNKELLKDMGKNELMDLYKLIGERK